MLHAVTVHMNDRFCSIDLYSQYCLTLIAKE